MGSDVFGRYYQPVPVKDWHWIQWLCLSISMAVSVCLAAMLVYQNRQGFLAPKFRVLMNFTISSSLIYLIIKNMQLYTNSPPFLAFIGDLLYPIGTTPVLYMLLDILKSYCALGSFTPSILSKLQIFSMICAALINAGNFVFAFYIGQEPPGWISQVFLD